MASGWANDDAVQQQIDSTIDDAVARARRDIPTGESLTECGEPIRKRVATRSPYVYAWPASRRKIYITLHFQDIIVVDRKIASFVDLS